MTGFLHESRCWRRVALVVGGLALILLLTAWADPPEPQSPDHPDVWRWDQVPISCSSSATCPTGATCLAGKCRYYCGDGSDCGSLWTSYPSGCGRAGYCQATGNDVDPPTINYLPPSITQIGGLCYLYAKFHAFQARVSIAVDQNGWYSWGKDDLDRSIPLTIAPYWQCNHGHFMRFTEVGGLVDQCLDPVPNTVFAAEPCGYYGRYMASIGAIAQEPCSAPQQAVTYPLVFRAGDWVEGAPLGSDAALAELLYQEGPVDVVVTGHEVNLVGYDFRTGTTYCFQNSWADDSAIFCQPKGTPNWTPLGPLYYPVNIQMPVEYNPSTADPFDDWILHDDKDTDGTPDAQDKDRDGDEAYNIFDPHPYNPWMRIDTDFDLHGEERLSGWTPTSREEVCLAWCEGLDQLTYLDQSHPAWVVPGAHHGGQACLNRCRSWDRCTTLAIKNVSDPTCNWTCMSTRNNNPICGYGVNDGLQDCCTADQIDNLLNTCKPIYYNVSNVDSDAQDPDQIADVCEDDPVVSGLDFRLDTFSYVQTHETPGGFTVRGLKSCTESLARIGFALYGGATWEIDIYGRGRILAQDSIERLGEVGSCGCTSATGDWADCLGATCYETVDWQPGDSSTQAWEDIEAPECPAWNWALPHPDPEDAELCADKRLVHRNDEDCSDGDCSLYDLAWRWTQHTVAGTPATLPGETIKVRVGERLLNQDWTQNELWVNPDALTLPADPIDCELLGFSNLATWSYIQVPREPPHGWPVDVGPVALGVWGLGQEPASRELFLFEFDRRMHGPLNDRKLAYGADTVPRLDAQGAAAVAASVESVLLDRETEAVPLFFLFGSAAGARGLAEGETAATPPLWVVDLEEGEIWQAEEIFGESEQAPPPMASPVALYDDTNSRFLVAGGGESGQFGIWAYTPLIGQWREISTTLPADLEGFALVNDSSRHRLLLVGGTTQGTDQAMLILIDLVNGEVAKGPKPPDQLARHGHAAALDLLGRKLYLFGGRQGDQLLADLWAMDLETFAWEQLDDGLSPGGPGPREGAQIFFESRYGKVWVAGGRDDGGDKLPDLWGYSPSSGEWEVQPLGMQMTYLPLAGRDLGP